jgi:hypothetical protein
VGVEALPMVDYDTNDNELIRRADALTLFPGPDEQ